MNHAAIDTPPVNVRLTRLMSSKYITQCGRKRKDFSQYITHKIKDDLFNHQRQFALACAANIPKLILFEIFRWENNLKPCLIYQNRLKVLKFCVKCQTKWMCRRFLRPHVHMDDKWFYLTKNRCSEYVFLKEKNSYLHCKSKRFIINVTFRVADTRPGAPDYDAHWMHYFERTMQYGTLCFKNRLTKTRKQSKWTLKNLEFSNVAEYRKRFLRT